MRLLKTVTLGHLRRVMTAGLIIVVPLAITFWVLRLVFNLMDGFLGPVIEERIGRDVPGIGIVAMLVLVYLIGQLWELSNLGKRTIGAVQNWLLSIPIVGTIYNPARRLIDSFAGTSESGLQARRADRIPQGRHVDDRLPDGNHHDERWRGWASSMCPPRRPLTPVGWA